VKDAGLDAIAKVPGFSTALATRVLTGLGVELPASIAVAAPQDESSSTPPDAE
jgi:hypothetical protein